MDNLRWVLLVIGLVIILLVYVFSRFNLLDKFGQLLSISPRPNDNLSSRMRQEPVDFDGEFDPTTEHDDVEFHVSEFTAEIPSVHHDHDDDHDFSDDWHETVSESKSTLMETEIEQANIQHDHHEDVPTINDQVEPDTSVSDVSHPEDKTPTLTPASAGASLKVGGTEDARHSTSTRARTQPPKQDPLPLDIQPLVLILSVMANPEQPFHGAMLIKVLEEEGLEHGDMEIFHYFHKGDDHQNLSPAIYSVANAVEPGTFDPGSVDEMLSPGITLFCQLPGALSPSQSFEIMLGHARNIAGKLHAKVCDDRRNALTSQRITHYHDRIDAFNRELILARKA